MRPASLGYCAQRLADSLTATTKIPDDDGQLNLPRGGHAELPGSGQRDYFA